MAVLPTVDFRAPPSAWMQHAATCSLIWFTGQHGQDRRVSYALCIGLCQGFSEAVPWAHRRRQPTRAAVQQR